MLSTSTGSSAVIVEHAAVNVEPGMEPETCDPHGTWMPLPSPETSFGRSSETVGHKAAGMHEPQKVFVLDHSKGTTESIDEDDNGEQSSQHSRHSRDLRASFGRSARSSKTPKDARKSIFDDDADMTPHSRRPAVPRSMSTTTAEAEAAAEKAMKGQTKRAASAYKHSRTIRELVKREREDQRKEDEKWMNAAADKAEQREKKLESWYKAPAIGGDPIVAELLTDPTKSGTMGTFDDTNSIRSSGSSRASRYPRANVRFLQLRFHVRSILRSQVFDAIIGLVIVANAANVGFEQTLRLQGKDTSFSDTLESIFLAIYVVELAMRFTGIGWIAIKDHWVKFDCFLVVLGVVNNWLLGWILGDVASEVQPLMILRMFRLIRLARTVRLLMKFRELWMLVRGLLSCASTMVYTLILLTIILYVFSCIGLEVLAESTSADPYVQDLLDTNFDNLGTTMLTLLQFVVLDSTAAVWKPLIVDDYRRAFYFVGIILVISIVCMNLITAVIVNSALEQASQDKEAQKIYEKRRRKRLIRDLTKRFERLDQNGNQQLTLDEILNGPAEDLAFICKSLKLDDICEVFELLDVKGTGVIDTRDFCEGLYNALTSETVELNRMAKDLRIMRRQLKDMESLFQLSLNRNFAALQGKWQDDGESDSIPAEEETLKAEITASTTAPPATPAASAPMPAWAREILRELRELKQNSEGILTRGAAPHQGSIDLPIGPMPLPLAATRVKLAPAASDAWRPPAPRKSASALSTKAETAVVDSSHTAPGPVHSSPHVIPATFLWRGLPNAALQQHEQRQQTARPRSQHDTEVPL